MKATGKAHFFGAAVKNSGGVTLEQAFDLLREELSADASADAEGVFAAHLEILEDPLLEESIAAGIADGMNPENAVKAASESISAMFADIDDEYLRARADDVRDVCKRLEMKIKGETVSDDIPSGCILMAEELFPSDMAGIDLSRVKGISCRKGSRTSHVAILAHSKGIPIVFGKDDPDTAEGDIVTIDDPFIGEGTVEKIRKAGRPVYANAGSLEDIRAAIEAGADGIGLFRTEFLYLNSREAPDLDFQKDIYIEALNICKGKTLTVRTMDIGGDKPVPWMPVPDEGNPFLGLRGIRLSLAHPDILKTQIEALALAAGQVPECRLRIMFPMVCSASEVSRAKALLGQKAAGLEFGAMIETPAAALDIDALCGECSFFSIGSNDLTQYVMAADRGNPAVAGYCDPLCAPVRYLIKKIVCDAHRHGIPVGICGEAASDPAATDFLLEAGLDSLSLNRL